MTENLMMLGDHFLQKTREEYCEINSTGLSDELSDSLKKRTRDTLERSHMISGALQGSLLIFFSKLIRPSRILELGTFTAYSTICLAQGLSENGEIVSIEKDEQLRETIDRHLSEAGISEKVELLFGDAMEIISELKGEFDLVFIDAAKRKYRNYVEGCLPLLKPGGCIIIDNVLFKNQVMNPPKKSKISKSVRGFNEWVQELPNVTRLMLPIRDGITLLLKEK